MTKRYYLAYGSNLNKKDMKERCKDARLIGSSYLEGYKLKFCGKDKRVYLTIEKSPGSKVPVGVFATSKEDELALDSYESYPDLYYKTDIPIRLTDESSGKGLSLSAYAYIMDKRYGLNTPSEEYFATCLKGYEDFGFDKTYLYEAWALSEND